LLILLYLKEPLMDKKELEQIVQGVLEKLRSPEYHLPAITWDLEEIGVEYCVVGGLALRFHNLLRATDKVEILVSRATYAKIPDQLIGCGYEKRPGSQHLYYVMTSLAIPLNVYVEGEDVGGLRLPNPKEVCVRFLGRNYCTLEFLVEWLVRAGDRSNLAELITENDLTEEFAHRLDPDVRSRYIEILKDD